MTGELRETRLERGGAEIIQLSILCGTGKAESEASRAKIITRMGELEALGYIVSRRPGTGGKPRCWHARGVLPRWKREPR